jgi:demethylmenaquinone methyltransferase/2-methoxy-6-polyprenyl-1,4-benzoquinol methylase
MPFDHFDLISPIYARTRFDPSHPLIGLLELPETGLVLDIGGGTGRVASVLVRLGQQVLIVDRSPGMLRQACGQPGMFPILADATALPFASAGLPRALVVDALHHIRDQQGAVNEFVRVLAPGGIGLIAEPDLRNFFVKLIQLFEWLMLMGSHMHREQGLAGLFAGKGGKVALKSWGGQLLLQFLKTA